MNSGAGPDLVREAQVWWTWSTADAQHVIASPVADERTVIIADTAGIVTALDIESGKPLWTYEVGKGIASTPAIAFGWVYVADTSGRLVALNLRDGQLVAEAKVGATRAPITVAEGKLFIGNEAGEMLALTATTLDILWRFKVSDVRETATYDNKTEITTCSGAHPARPVRTAAAVHLGVVVFASMNHYAYAVDEQGNPDQTTSLLWRHQTGDIVLASPVIDAPRGRVYLAGYDEAVRSLPIAPQDAGTLPCFGGTATQQWLFDVPGTIDASKVHSTPALDGTNLYFGANNGNLYAIAATTGQAVWTMPSGGPVIASPVVANGTVVVGSDDGTLRWVDAATGMVVAGFKTDSPVKNGVAVHGATIIVAAEDGRVYRLGGDLPARADLAVLDFIREGKGVSIIVSNVGAVRSEPTTLQIWLNGTMMQEFPVPALDPDERVEFYFLAIGEEGALALEAVLDADETLLEAGRENNRLARLVAAPVDNATLAPVPTEDRGLLGLAWWIWIVTASVVLLATGGLVYWLWWRSLPYEDEEEWYEEDQEAEA